MAMAAASMPRETTPSSPLHSPALPLCSSSPAAVIPSGEVHGETPASGKVCRNPQESGDGRQELPHLRGDARSASTPDYRAFAACHHNGEMLRAATQHRSLDNIFSVDAYGEPQVIHDSHLKQRDGSEAPRSLPSPENMLKKTADKKRPASNASGSLRASKAAKVIDAKQEANEVCGESHLSDDVRGGRQVTGEARVGQRDSSEVPKIPSTSKKISKKVTPKHSEEMCPTVGSKRPRSDPSGSLRESKVAKVINSKVVMKQLQKQSKIVGRKTPLIVSGSPMINMMARKRAQSNARSPNSHPRSPNSTGILKSPSLLDLSPAPTHSAPTSMHDVSPAISTHSTPTSMHDGSPAVPLHGSTRRPRKLTSVIWKDADPIYVNGLLMQGQCKYCKDIFPASKVSGSSQLGRHLKVCEVKISMDGVVEQLKNSDEIDPNWKFDQEDARIELVKLIVLHGLPFTFVEYSGFRKFCQSLNPWFKSVNRVTIQNDCMDAYHHYRDFYEEVFINCNYRVSLTGDMWTSNQKLGYLCITCHWIDSKWKVKHRIIRFCLVETPHDSWNMFDVVLSSLRKWNIEDKIFSFTMDNAEVNTKMLKHLRKNLDDRNLLHHEGKLLHVRCAAHVLNLIVQDGLKAMKSVVDNVRDSVKYVRSSQFRKDQFASMISQVGVDCKHKPSLDVSTRWNSTLLMLESALPFRKAFETLDQQEPNYKFCPSDEEWKMAQDICQLLKVFFHATKVVSGSNYPTSNLYFHEIWSVKLVLDEQAKSKNPTVRIMVEAMHEKFDKYFKESYLTNCIQVVLDPRFKLDLVEFRLKKYFTADADKHIKEVHEAIEVLFLEYATEVQESADVLSQDGNNEQVDLADSSFSAFSDWDEHVKHNKKAKSRSELQRYLEEEFHPRTPDFDILKWWAINAARYPILGTIARDVLAIPASTVASESAFSICGRVISDHTSSLGPETVEA